MSSSNDYFVSTPAPPAGRPGVGSYPAQPQQWAQSQQWAPQRPGSIPPGQPYGAGSSRPPAAPRPGFFRRWNRRRRIASLVLGLVVLSIRLATGDLDLTPGPTDMRPVVLPETLGGSAQSTQETAVQARDQVVAQTADWWPGRSTGVAYYESGNAAAAGRSALYRASAGAHVIAVRGKFEGKGDADVFRRADKIGMEIQHSTGRFGSNSCAWATGASHLTVCWHETDRLSISVLLLDSTTPDEAARLVDEAWAAVA